MAALIKIKLAARVDSESRFHHQNRVRRGPVAAMFFAAFAMLGAACEQNPAPAPPAVAASVLPEPPQPPVASAPPAPPPVTAADLESPQPVGSAPRPKPRTVTRPPASAPAPPTASAEPPVRPATMARGSSASGEGFSVWIQAPTPVRAGKSASAQVVLAAKDPYKCNDKYPYKFVLDAPSGGLSYPAQTVRTMSIGEKQSSMSIPFTAARAGGATIAGQLHFSVCTAEKCLIEKRPLSVTVQVE
jgi:hypothetical protein